MTTLNLILFMLFKHIIWLQTYGNWLNRTFVVWITSIAAMIIVSLVTRPPSPAQLEGIIWSPAMAELPDAEKPKHRGLRSLFLWWAVFVSLMVALYAYMIWFQFWGPAKGL